MEPNELVELAHILASHQNVTHWAISMRIFGRGDVFSRLQGGHNCHYTTIKKAERYFAECWPDDLAWPEHVTRPDKQVSQERVA